MICREAIEEVFANESGVLSTRQVVERIYAKYPDQPWKRNTISAHLIGLSVNHPSSQHHRVRQHAFLFSLGNGRYRRWNPEQDGVWEITEQGVRLSDESEESRVAEGEFESQAVDTSLSLERDMERALLTDLEQLESGLRLYEEDGLLGNQLDTGAVGRLDILGIDRNDDLVVVELKARKANDRVCGQILRYMGWVKENLAGQRQVWGIIVADDFSESLKYAVQAMPNVALKKYKIRFEFTDV